MSSDLAAAALAGLASRGLLSVAVVRDGRVAWASQGFSAMFGLDPSGAAGRPFLDLVAPEDRAPLARVVDKNPPATFTPAAFHALRPDGGRFDAELSSLVLELPGGPAVVLEVRDITEQRRVLSRLSELAFIDALTELPNRALFIDRLRLTLSDARRHGNAFAVLVGDLDGFKQVNDRYGHETGDALLKVAARRLRASMREGDTVARVGGDEFAALLTRASNQEEAGIVAQRMVDAFNAPIAVAGQQCQVGLSAGITLYPTDGKDMDALIARADGAMYVAKRAGGRRFEFAQIRRADITGPLRLPLFEWHETYDTGVAIIDEEHKRLAAEVNRVGNEIKAGEGHERLKEALRRLVDAARAHFAREEMLIARAGLGALAERYRKEQGALFDELEDQAARFGTRSTMLTTQGLSAWLARHIEGAKMYVAQLLARGMLV